MAFMEPEYTKEDFVVVEGRWESYALPAEYFSEADLEPGDDYEVIEGGWWCRLSAPGYMDATEWMGPFDTLEDAREELSYSYDVDPDTGDSLWDE